MKKQVAIILIICLVVTQYSAIAATLADPVFDYTASNLSSSKTVSFCAETFNTVESIRVTRVVLYQKNSSNAWVYSKDLTVPTDVSYDYDYFYCNMDYSNDIGSGTYRLYVTYCAEGHSISRYSNTRTF